MAIYWRVRDDDLWGTPEHKPGPAARAFMQDLIPGVFTTRRFLGQCPARGMVAVSTADPPVRGRRGGGNTHAAGGAPIDLKLDGRVQNTQPQTPAAADANPNTPPQRECSLRPEKQGTVL